MYKDNRVTQSQEDRWSDSIFYPVYEVMSDTVLKDIVYLESLISDILDNGLTELALKKQAELDELYKRLDGMNNRARKIKAERVFRDY